jgi:hypothetical protein
MASLPYSLQRAELKLESRELSDDVLVIDHLEKAPTELSGAYPLHEDLAFRGLRMINCSGHVV